MKCQQCQSPYTFNMECRQCIIKHIRMIPKAHAKLFLKAYRDQNGEQEMLKLIEEVKEVPIR